MEVYYKDILKMKEYVSEWNKVHHKDNIVKTKDKIYLMQKRLDKLIFDENKSNSDSESERDDSSFEMDNNEGETFSEISEQENEDEDECDNDELKE